MLGNVSMNNQNIETCLIPLRKGFAVPRTCLYMVGHKTQPYERINLFSRVTNTGL